MKCFETTLYVMDSVTPKHLSLSSSGKLCNCRGRENEVKSRGLVVHEYVDEGG